MTRSASGDPGSPAPGAARYRRTVRLSALVLGCLLGLGFLEIGARIHVGRTWSEERLRAFTSTGPVIGLYAPAPDLPYVLAPDLPGGACHNALGLRGPAAAVEKPASRTRIACIGASTTYGFPGPECESYPRVLERLFAAAGRGDVEVLNAGVPGWVSTEIVHHFATRILPMGPDLVIHYEGRNEVFPEGYRNYREDYAHYRRPDWSFEGNFAGHRRLFRCSRLALLLCTWRGDRFGWSTKLSNPVYGCIESSNEPEAPEFQANLADPSHYDGFRSRLLRLADLCAGARTRLVLVTMGIWVEKFGSGCVGSGPGFSGPFGEALLRNNQIVREVARSRGLLLVEGAALSADPDLFTDDCHFTKEGYERLAGIVHAALEAQGLPARPAR
jgi:lysophospholipase L1-like esterase